MDRGTHEHTHMDTSTPMHSHIKNRLTQNTDMQETEHTDIKSWIDRHRYTQTYVDQTYTDSHMDIHTHGHITQDTHIDARADTWVQETQGTH
jgi:hypothetical protein